jgi:hypothetical protein
MTEPTNSPLGASRETESSPESQSTAPQSTEAQSTASPSRDDSAGSEGDTGSGGDEVRIATYLPHVLVFGDRTITHEGVAVSDSEADEIRAAAAQNGVTVYEMES